MGHSRQGMRSPRCCEPGTATRWAKDKHAHKMDQQLIGQHGGVEALFDGVCAPSKIANLQREFTLRTHPPAGIGAASARLMARRFKDALCNFCDSRRNVR